MQASLVWAFPISLAATFGISRQLSLTFWFLFPGLLRWFNSPGFALLHYLFMQQYTDITQYGFPHSVIDGLTIVCISPSLFAAYHDLLRLMVPRHSPIALIYLAILSCRIVLSILAYVLSWFHDNTIYLRRYLFPILKTRFFWSNYIPVIQPLC